MISKTGQGGFQAPGGVGSACATMVSANAIKNRVVVFGDWTEAFGTRERRVMKWQQDAVLGILRRDPPVRDANWSDIAAGLTRIGCTVIETPGLHLSVVLEGRMARFQQGAVGTAWAYQLADLRAFLAGAE